MQEVLSGRPLLLTFGLALALALACSACDKAIEQPEARRRARAELERYAKSEGYDVRKYGDPIVREEDPYWLYSYFYGDPPKHEVVVTVDRWGKIEVSRSPDGEPVSK